MINALTRLLLILSLVFLIACEEQQLSYPSTWSDFTLSDKEFSELIATIENEFKADSEQWNEKIDYKEFSSYTLPGYTKEQFAKIHFAPTYSSEKVRHFIVINCERDLEKTEDWNCEKIAARSVYYALNNTWILIAGDKLSDEEGIRFFENLTKTTEIPVYRGKDLITNNIEFAYLAEEEDGTLTAEILDKEHGSGSILFSSKKDESPTVLTVIKMTYDCVDQNMKDVNSAFPCDYETVDLR